MMKKIVLVALLFHMTLFGYEYDNLLLKAQANIFPKLVLLDNEISRKVTDKEILFCIVYHPSDRLKAVKIKKMIKEKFKNRLEDYKLKVVVNGFDQIKKDDRSTAYYILQGEDEKVKYVCNIAKSKKALTFVYDTLYFKDDALISLGIEDCSTLYLNKRVHKDYGIDFMDIFYQIVRFKDD